MASIKRAEKVNRLLREEISKIIQLDIKDPKLGFVTVTKSQISHDLKYAKVFVSVYGDDKSVKNSMCVLNKAKLFVRGEIGRRINLRYTPEINFVYDETVQNAFHLFELLNKVKQEEKKEE